MSHVICRELRNFQVEEEIAYGSETLALMVVKYLWGTLQAHIVMGDFLRTQLRYHPEVAP